MKDLLRCSLSAIACLVTLTLFPLTARAQYLLPDHGSGNQLICPGQEINYYFPVTAYGTTAGCSYKWIILNGVMKEKGSSNAFSSTPLEGIGSEVTVI